MKKVLAFIIALMVLAAMIPGASAAGSTVYVSVSIDGKLEVAAQPVEVTEMTADAVIRAAHAAYYSGGEGGYAAGIDPTYNMFLITQAWGITATPYIIINGAPLGSDPANPAAADAAPVQAGDNIIICTSSDVAVPATPVALTASVDGTSATVTATSWMLDFTTFAYSSAPLAGTAIIDPATGAALGTTDAAGKADVAIPESALAAVDGLAAINLNVGAAAPVPADNAAPASSPDTAAAPDGAAAPDAPPAAAETPLFYPPTNSLLIAMAVVLIPVFIIIAIKMTKQSRLDKKVNAGGRQR
ncbi:MAG: hypothetical protein GX847_05685 [Clostridiales bacterium]|nr:hypothetical protein [Clostridiales bacterium]